MVGEHIEENILKYVIEVIKEYSIIHNLGYFVIDNAPNNDTIITTLSLTLRRDF